LCIKSSDLFVGEPYGLKDVVFVHVLHTTCVFDAQEDLNIGAYNVQDTYKDGEDVEVFGGWTRDAEMPFECVHDSKVLARVASNECNVPDRRAPSCSNCECLFDGEAMVCYKFPDVRGVSGGDAEFVGLPLPGLQRIAKLIRNDRPDARVELSDKHDRWQCACD
jgi:hypothetical protein